MSGAASGGGPTLDRRRFLRLTALGAGALIASPLLEACSNAASGVPTSLRAAVRSIAGRSKPGLQLFPGGQEFLAARAQRFPFGLIDATGSEILGPQARVWIGQGRGARGPFEANVRLYRRLEQTDDPRGFYVTSFPMPSSGLAWVMVEASGLYGYAPIQVLATPTTPGDGQRAISVETPTFGDARGVARICTRTPPCPMHSMTLSNALRARRPIVFALASPLLCTSRTCGPVVDEVLDVRAHIAARATFVHAEPYKGDTATTLSPTAQAWRIPSEPWIWIIDGAGVVRARFEGPVVASEIEPAVARVL